MYNVQHADINIYHVIQLLCILNVVRNAVQTFSSQYELSNISFFCIIMCYTLHSKCAPFLTVQAPDAEIKFPSADTKSYWKF